MKHDVAWARLLDAIIHKTRDANRPVDMKAGRTNKPIIRDLAILSGVADTGRVEQEAS
jgi:hypothetical protein